MATQLQSLPKPEVIYPDSDGEPMSDNTQQFELIVWIKENLELLFANNRRRKTTSRRSRKPFAGRKTALPIPRS